MQAKAVLVTGASSGIGRAIVLLLDEMGYRVYAGVRKSADVRALQKETSHRLTPVILDVTREAHIKKAFKLISRESGDSFYALINNAGIAISGVLEATPEDELRKVLEVNVIGMHAVTRAFLPLLRKNKGRIINMGSASSFRVVPGMSSYVTSKFAIRAISDVLRIEVRHFGIHVSLIVPGPVESKIWEKFREYKRRIRKKTSPELLEQYSVLVRAEDRLFDQDAVKPIPAEDVARAVARSLNAGKPACIYTVGVEAKLAYQLARLPRSLFTWLIMKRLKKLAGES